MTPQEKAVELMHRYQMEMGVTTYDILMEMAAFMTDKACRWLVEHTHNSDTQDGITCTSVMTEGTLIEDFRKAMEGKRNPLFDSCLAKVDPEIREEVRRNMEDLQDLTWKDIKRIVEIADNESLLNHCAEECWTQEAYYTEVLRRFKEGK